MHLQRVCFTLQIRPERLTEYRERHVTVWPELLDALTAAGWGNYSLFLREDGLLIGYLETEDFDKARAAMDGTDVNERWQREMAPFFELPGDRSGAAPDAAMLPLPEIFHLSGPRGAHSET